MIRRTWLQMGMPITVCIQDEGAGEEDVAAVADWLDSVDRRFSPYRETSEVSRLNMGQLEHTELSDELADILERCEQTKVETNGYFDPVRNGRIDPSGLVKGWAVLRASALLTARGWLNHIVDAGGDVQAVGYNADGAPWRVGIRNPFQRDQIVKILAVSNRGVATSGTAVRGPHIYNPWQPDALESDVVSLTVIGPTICDADRFATAAFAMGRNGLIFIAIQPELEAYAVMADGTATFTPGFQHYVH